MRFQDLNDQAAFEWESDGFSNLSLARGCKLLTTLSPAEICPAPTAALLPGGERRKERTDPKTIEDPKVMIHRPFTLRCRLGD